MNSVREQNQQHPPQSKQKRVDAQGNDRRRLIVKDHGASTIIAEGCTKNCYDIAWNRFVSTIVEGGGKITVQVKVIP